MTKAAIESPIAQKEWHYARQQGVCVYPVKCVSDSALDYNSLPNWMKKAHFFDLEREWDTFISYLKSPCRAVRVPFMVPDLPETFIERPALFNQAISQLLDANRENPVAITIVLYGFGGLGKTTLATGLCHHDAIITAFDDGVLWATLGEQPNVKEELAKLYAALTGDRPAFVDSGDVSFHLAQKLDEKNYLMVIDDVWHPEHLQLFLRGGKNCARLITTRTFEVAAEYKRRIKVDEMTPSEALRMFRDGLPTTDDLTPFRELIPRLGEWPLMMKLARGTLKHQIALGDTVDGALDYLKKKLDKQGIVAFDQRNATKRDQAIGKTIEASLEPLKQDERDRYLELAIFPKDSDIPVYVVGKLWGLDDFDTKELSQSLYNFMLIDFNLQAGTIRLHDVLQAYLIKKLSNAANLHAKLVNAWGDLHHLSDDYAWHCLSHHLVESGRMEQLRQLLLDFDWLQAKLVATDVMSLLEDYSFLQDDKDVRLVQAAIRLSTHVVAHDRIQFAAQLIGRLAAENSSVIQALLKQAKKWCGSPWLRPLVSTLTPPGGALQRTLIGHTDLVTMVAVTADSSGRAVSSSRDGTLKVWDLRTGKMVGTLEGHTAPVITVAVTADGRRAISGSRDGVLKAWELETR